MAVAVAFGASWSPAVSGSDESPIVCVDSVAAAAVIAATSSTPATAASPQSRSGGMPSP